MTRCHRPAARARIEICILAGGMSTRMGRDKARLQVEGRSLLARARAAARATGLGVRVIRRDVVPRCGPLGGVYTALATSRAGAVLFLACDMPFVSVDLLERVLHASQEGARPTFSTAHGKCGFPFVLPRAALETVQAQMTAREFSLHALATNTNARRLRVAAASVFNINTPEELQTARRRRLSDRG